MPTKKKTTEQFVLEAVSKHKGKYLYDKVVYVNNESKVIITCPEHGDFEQAPVQHLRGKGCRKCAYVSSAAATSSSTEGFVLKAEMLHKRKYTYEKAIYVNSKTKITISCPEHGDFKQSPNSHLSGQGCPVCRRISQVAVQSNTTSDFISKATAEHAGRYLYTKAVYVNNLVPITITCPEHGDFEQIPNNHLRGHGCPRCASFGYDQAKAGSLYILKSEDASYKIGISNRPEQRLKQLIKATPFPIERIALFNWSEGKYAQDLEHSLHQLLKKEHAGFTGFNGCTEWFNLTPEELGAVLDLAAGYHRSHQRTKPAGTRTKKAVA